MTALDDVSLRDQLAAALAPLDPLPPPFPQLVARGRRRRHRRRIGVVAAAVGAVAAVTVIAVVAVGPGDNATVTPAAPSRHSLVSYARAHGGTHITGPLAGAAAAYGAFAVHAAGRTTVDVVAYRHRRWQPDGSSHAIVPAGPVQRIAPGPRIDPAAPTFWVTLPGGDVSFFSLVLHHVNGRWQRATFGHCGHRGLCAQLTDEQPYGHPVGAGGFVSVLNDCTPYCAAGTQYRIHWQWSASRDRFVARTVQPLHP